jgi:hypothetical protein
MTTDPIPPNDAGFVRRHRELEFRAKKEAEDRAREQAVLEADRALRQELEQRALQRQIASRLAAARAAFDEGRPDVALELLDEVRALSPELDRDLEAPELEPQPEAEHVELLASWTANDFDAADSPRGSTLAWCARMSVATAVGTAIVTNAFVPRTRPLVRPTAVPAATETARALSPSIRLRSFLLNVAAVGIGGGAAPIRPSQGALVTATAPPPDATGSRAIIDPAPAVTRAVAEVSPPSRVEAANEPRPLFTPSTVPLPPFNVPPAAMSTALEGPDRAATGTSGSTDGTAKAGARDSRAPGAAAAEPASGAETAERAALDQVRIREALDAYARAYAQLDARAAQAVWPGVDGRALSRAFAALESQAIDLGQCDVSSSGPTAIARCQGSASYVTRVGHREREQEPRRWEFSLRKAGERWTIQSAKTERAERTDRQR